jgi:formylglycine-generating enzyme required for sulfatase activity
MFDPSTQLLLRRLDQLSDEFRDLKEGVRKALNISDDDPEMALTRARKVLEYVVQDVFRLRYNEKPGSKPLEQLLHRLVSDGHIPRRLGAYANNVRELGNIGVHAHGEEVTKEDVRRSLDNLTTIIEWYFEKVRPDAITKAEEDAREEEEPVVSQPPATPHTTSVGQTQATPQPTTQAAGKPQSVKNSIGMEFVWVPPGSFMMGSEREDDEKPVHRVTINQGFYMGKYEVMQAQWQKVMGNNPSKFKGCDNCPVENVSWDDAQKFINGLNAQDDGYIYRLPSEAEWEYACRAGTAGDYAGDLDAMA